MPSKRKPLDLARMQRAATERMIVKEAGRPHCYYVESKRGTYLVNTAQDTCTCRDFRHRIRKLRRTQPNARCKHLIRVNSGRKSLQAQLLYAPLPEESV